MNSIFEFFDKNNDNIMELSEVSDLWKDLSYDES